MLTKGPKKYGNILIDILNDWFLLYKLFLFGKNIIVCFLFGVRKIQMIDVDDWQIHFSVGVEGVLEESVGLGVGVGGSIAAA